VNRKAAQTSLFAWVILLLFWPSVSLSFGQSVVTAAQARPRITERIDDLDTVRMQNSVPRALRNAVDLGRLDGGTNIGPLVLFLKSSPEQEHALKTLLDEQQDKFAPRYHKWMTPDEFGATYGVDEVDLKYVSG